MSRIVIEAWQSPLLTGRAAGLAAARSRVNVARLVRVHRPIAWRTTCARLLAEAAQTRRYLAAGRVGAVLLDELLNRQEYRL